MLYNETLDEAA